MFGTDANKPSAMEAMVAKMLGFTPDQMAETISGLRDTIVAVAASLKRIEEKQGAILDRIEELENERRDRDNNSRGGNTGRRARNSDVGQRDGGADHVANGSGTS